VKKIHGSLLLLITGFFLAGSLVAEENVGPLRLVELTVNDVVADMNVNQDVYVSDSAKLQAMVLDRVAPHFHFRRMVQLAMANHWAAATPAQRAEITDGMLKLLVRTYANSMFTFRNQPINLVGERQTGENSAIVRLSVTNSSSGQPVDVILRMENRNDRWQVVDVVVGGVSMVITYRGTFAEEIRRSGIDGLIASIKKNNLDTP